MTTAVLDRGAARVVAPGDSRPVAAYDRISKFKTRTGVVIERDVARQYRDNKACAEDYALGTVVRYSDEDRSASRFATREREEWVRLLADVAAGTYSAVLMWLVDRLIRQTADLDTLLAACRQGNAVLIQSGSGTVVHPDDPDAVAMMKIGGVLAEAEVAKTSKRVRRAMESIRQSGQPHPGRRRFGYEPGMVAVREAEAEVVRDLAARLLAGTSLYVLAQELTAAGITGPSGATFTGPNLRNLMLRPHLAGYQVHRGEIMREAGQPVRGAWTPILDHATWEAVRGLLSDPSRRTSASTARRYLLSGLGVCGVCGRTLRARTQGNGDRLQPAYMCETTSHVSRVVDLVDEIVVSATVARLCEIDPTGAPMRPDVTDPTDALRQRRDLVSANLNALAVDRALGAITGAEYEAARGAVAAEVARLDSRIADLAVAVAVPDAALEGLTGQPAQVARDLFDGLPLGRKRAVIKALGGRVVLHKAARRGARFDPDAVEVTWDA